MQLLNNINPIRPKAKSVQQTEKFERYTLNGYEIIRKNSKGGFGTIFKANDNKTNNEVAIKMTKHSNENEYNLLYELQGVKGIPQLKNQWQYGNQHYLVMEYLKSDLLDISPKFSLKTVLMVGIQMLEILSELHNRQIVHRDIKPANIMIRNYQCKQVYLIDFGLAVKLKTAKILSAGTINYDPISVHRHQSYEYIDDIEMLAYTMTQIFLGTLPWKNIPSVTMSKNQVLRQKLKFLDSKGMGSLPFSDIFVYIKRHTRQNIPDHNFIIQLFRKIMKQYDLIEDYEFDWMKQKNTVPVVKSLNQIRGASDLSTIQVISKVRINKSQEINRNSQTNLPQNSLEQRCVYNQVDNIYKTDVSSDSDREYLMVKQEGLQIIEYNFISKQ